MKKSFYYILFSLISIVLQVNFRLFFPGIEPMPDILLILVIYSGLLAGGRTGFIVGFSIGLIQDILLGGVFGSYTIAKSILGGISGVLEGQVYKKNILIPPLIVLIISFFQELLIIPFSERLLFNLHFWQTLKSYVLPFSFYNMILAFGIYITIYLVYFSRSNYYE